MFDLYTRRYRLPRYVHHVSAYEGGHINMQKTAEMDLAPGLWRVIRKVAR